MTSLTLPTSIAAEAAMVDLIAHGERTDAEIQRSLAQGRCAQCDLPIKTGYKRRRPCLCTTCGETLSWCSTCQRPKPLGAFPRCRRSPNGLNRECRQCRRGRKRARKPLPRCGRAGCTRLVALTSKGYPRKLCEQCLRTHAWCSDCERARLRREFAREVRHHKRHAAICLECDRSRRPATGAKDAVSREAQARYAAIRDYAAAHPTAGKAEIRAALGVSMPQIKAAMDALGFRIGFGPLKAAALTRYRAVVDLSLAEIMAREGLTYQGALKLRCRARKAIAEAGGA
jgi:hypothetical protein